MGKGVVAVSMDIMMLDIDQCPEKYYVPNAFKDTHKRDDKSSYCVPILGRGFATGGYECPFEGPITYYDGQLVEAEFISLVDNKETRFDMLKCRLAGATKIDFAYAYFIIMAIVTLFFNRAPIMRNR